MFGPRVDEIEESGAVVELGEEDGVVGLRLRILDPLQGGTDAAIVAAPFAQHPASVTTHPRDASGIVAAVDQYDVLMMRGRGGYLKVDIFRVELTWFYLHLFLREKFSYIIKSANLSLNISSL